MGGAASSAMIGVLEEEMDEEFLHNLMKENFDPIMFNTLKDENNMVSKELLLSVINKGAEREVYLLFMGYVCLCGVVQLLTSCPVSLLCFILSCRVIIYHALSGAPATNILT
jgi:hypothetical protein